MCVYCRAPPSAPRPAVSSCAGSGLPATPAARYPTFSLPPVAGRQLVSDHRRVDAQGRGPDLTGTVIESSLPVAVYVGHDCTNIPENRVAFDHPEEQLFPNATWGRDYLVPALRDRGPTNPPVVRTVPQVYDTHSTLDPPPNQPPPKRGPGAVPGA